MKISEGTFLKELEKRNPLAIEFIVRKYGALVQSVIDRYLRGNRQASEECFNDVLLAIWNHSGTFDDKKSTFKNWLCAIAKYRAIDTLRREAKYRERFLSFDAESSIDWLERVWQPEEENRGKDESLEELKKLLRCLSEEDKDLFFRRYVDEQPVADIAREKKTNPGRIYARISRGRKKLKHSLECQNGGMMR